METMLLKYIIYLNHEIRRTQEEREQAVKRLEELTNKEETKNYIIYLNGKLDTLIRIEHDINKIVKEEDNYD